MYHGYSSTEEILDNYGIHDEATRREILREDSRYSARGYWSHDDHEWQTADGDIVINGIDIYTGEYVDHDFDA